MDDPADALDGLLGGAGRRARAPLPPGGAGGVLGGPDPDPEAAMPVADPNALMLARRGPGFARAWVGWG